MVSLRLFRPKTLVSGPKNTQLWSLDTRTHCPYVSEELSSLTTENNAIQVLKNTKEMFWLHKSASNHNAVIESFAPKELAKNPKDLGLDVNSLPLQSLNSELYLPRLKRRDAIH